MISNVLIKSLAHKVASVGLDVANIQTRIDKSEEYYLMSINRYSVLAVSVSLCLATTALQAGGFGVTVQSASGGGSSATNHAMAEDASAMWYNPALLSSVEGTQVNGGLSLLSSDLQIENTGSALPSAGGGTPVFGENSAEPGGVSVTPSLYYKRDINDHMAFGLGVTIPFGVSSEYERDSFARYEATESTLTTVNFNPALSWRLSDRLDIGAGLNIQYGTATLSRSIDGFLACRSIAANSALTTDTCDAIGLDTPSNEATDSHIETQADGVGYGANIGLAYHPTKSTTFSVGYRSSVKYDLEGEAEFDHGNLALLGDPTLNAVGLGKQDITADLELPASLSLAVASQVSNKLTLHGDVTWTEWSTVPEIRIVFPDTVTSDSVTDLQWEDTVRVGVGATYQFSPKTKLRAGIAYDPTPTPSAEHRTPRAPRSDTMWYSAGLSHQVNKKLTVDASLSLIQPDDTTVNYTSPGSTDYLTRADVETDALGAALSVNYKF
ncbi:hypothetical protein EOL70_12375 [Leucothrix sargassi]|nr:hypothetical protein EOL70_12375 [Leucothrix sargassi]